MKNYKIYHLSLRVFKVSICFDLMHFYFHYLLHCGRFVFVLEAKLVLQNQTILNCSYQWPQENSEEPFKTGTTFFSSHGPHQQDYNKLSTLPIPITITVQKEQTFLKMYGPVDLKKRMSEIVKIITSGNFTNSKKYLLDP